MFVEIIRINTMSQLIIAVDCHHKTKQTNKLISMMRWRRRCWMIKL